MANKIQFRRDTAANWTSVNPTISQGELAYETDTTKYKIGDGTTAWTSLAYNTSYSDADVDTHLNTSTATTGEYLSWNGADYDWATVPAGYTDSDVDTHLNTSTATTGEVLSWTGTDYDWIAAGGGGAALELYAENPGTYIAPSATGTNAVAIGDEALANNTGAIALGYSSKAAGTNSVALGNASANGNSSLAAGFYAQTDNTGTAQLALGYSAISRSTFSTAIGYNAQAAVNSGATALTNSYASGADSFAAAIANNTSAYGATGANSVAMGQLAKSTAAQSISMGNTSFASGVKSMALGGYYARSEGENSLALGSYSLAENVGSVAIGPYSQAKTIGKVAFNASSTGSMTTGPGKQQRGLYILKATTADATQTVLTGNGSTPDASNSWIIGIAAAQAFSGTLIARQDRDDGHDYAAWEIKGAALRNATVVELGTAIVNKLYNSTGASAWAIAVSANTTLGTIEIKVTGAASTDIDWVATIDTSELVNI